jgi:TolA-binding protein
MRESLALTYSPTPPPHWWLTLILTLMLWCATSIGALAHAQTPPSEAELVRVPVRVIRQCEADAARVDGLESRLRACQRDLDAGSGALGEAQRSAQEARLELARAQLRVAELERQDAARWSPWAWMGIGAGGVVAALVVGALVMR